MQQLDPTIVNLTKAIRQTESGGDFTARGGSGEYGAYQYTPDTWKGAAAKYGVNAPLETATPQQQNEVTYKRVAEWKKAGYNVGQIASMWNAGEGKPNAYKENWKGVNQYGVAYDTPAYAKKVATAYQGFKGQTPATEPAPTPEPEEKMDVGGMVKEIISPVTTMIARPFQAIAGLAGASNESIDKWTDTNLENIGLGGLVKPTPKNYGDVKKDVGRGIQTAAFGMAPISGGAAFGAGMSLEEGNDLASWDTLAYTVGGGLLGKGADIVGKPLLNAAGKVVGKVTPEILQRVAKGGAKAVAAFMKRNKILPDAVSKGINTGAEALERGANAPFKAGKALVTKTDDQIVAARQKALEELEEKYTSSMGRLARENPGAASRVARSNVLADANIVSKDGKIIGAIDAADNFGATQIGEANKAVRKLLEREAVAVDIAILRREMRRTAQESIKQAGERQRALTAIEKEIKALRADNPNGQVKLTDLHDSKTQLYADVYKGNYANPGVKRAKRQVGRAYKETIEKYSKENVRKINKELEQLYSDQKYIKALQGKQVGSGKLSGMVQTAAASATGAVVGGAMGGIGGAVGAGLAAGGVRKQMAARAARKAFGKTTKKAPAKSKVLSEAVSKANNPPKQKLLPPGSGKTPIKLGAPKGKSGVRLVKAPKDEVVRDLKTGKYKRTYLSGTEALKKATSKIKKGHILESKHMAQIINNRAKEVAAGKRFGYTANIDGTEYVGKEAIATIESKTLTVKNISPERIHKILKKNADLYGKNDFVKVGVFKMENGGVSIDINVATKDRALAKRIAKLNNQESFWDAGLEKEVKTGGTGVQRFNRKEIRETMKAAQATSIPHTGQQNAEFFTTKAKKASSPVVYKPVIKTPQVDAPTKEAFYRYTMGGNFTGHISKMIPAFAEKQMAVTGAIAKSRATSFLDIGASEGGVVKTVSKMNPKIKSTALDPNPQMRENYNLTPDVKNAEFKMEALGGSWSEKFKGKNVDIKEFKPTGKYDIINEDYAFQFISNDRKGQVRSVKKMLSDDGLFITSEKFKTANDKVFENRKLDHQKKYFSKDQLTEDKQTIVTGMADDMVNDLEYEKILQNEFKYVTEYWNSGNFKGYVASDSKAAMSKFVKDIGNVNSEFSAVKTPRVVTGGLQKPRGTRVLKPTAKSEPVSSVNLTTEAKKYKTADEFVKNQEVVYHGSAEPLKKFNDKQGTFFTDDMMNADGYAGGKNVYEGYLNLKRPLVINAKGRKWDDLKTPYGKSTQEIAGNFDKKKYDGIIFKNIKDSWIDDVDAQIPGTVYYVTKTGDSFLNQSQLENLWKAANKGVKPPANKKLAAFKDGKGNPEAGMANFGAMFGFGAKRTPKARTLKKPESRQDKIFRREDEEGWKSRGFKVNGDGSLTKIKK